MSILLTDIKHYCLQDGPGLRTVVFLKGCPLRCPWCCNPECQLPIIQPYSFNGENGTYGEWCDADKLLRECLTDKEYYIGDIEDWRITKAEELLLLPGGVTFTGGECLMQAKELIPVLSGLKKEKIHIAVETSLFVPFKLLTSTLEYIDLFYVDVKILDRDRCQAIEHGDIDLYISNLELLMSNQKPVVFHIPVIGHYTDDNQNLALIKDLLKKYPPIKIELIKGHNFGKDKYRSLGWDSVYHQVTDDFMEQYKNYLSDIGIPIEILAN